MSAMHELLNWKSIDELGLGNYICTWVNDGDASASHHWHRELEIVLVLEGEVNLGVNKEDFSVPAGNFFIINSGDIHYFLPSPGSRRAIIQLDLKIFDDLECVKNNQLDLLRLFNSAHSSTLEWDPKLKKKLVNRLTVIHDEFQGQEPGFELAIRSKLYEILLILFREVPWVNEDDNHSSHRQKNVIYLKEIYGYLEANYQNSIQLKDIADYIGFTPAYFSKFFKKHHGVTFLKYLTQYRLTKVQWKLLNENSTIIDIACSSGFSNLKTFNRVFKAELGQTPTEFRKRQFLRK